MISIPLPIETPFFDLQVVLEGVTYTLEIRWNVRASAWFMNIYDVTGQVLLHAGIKLVADFPRLVYTTARKPPGLFFLNDTAGLSEECTFEGLGVRWQLMYLSTEELGI